MIRLIAVDMDGTLLRDDHYSISRENIAALEAAARRGVSILPATGRVLSNLPAGVRGIQGIRYALTSNGAAVWELQTRDKVLEQPMSREQTVFLTELLARHGLYYELYWNGDAFADQSMMRALTPAVAPAWYIERIKRVTRAVPDLRAFVRERAAGFEKINIPAIPSRKYDALLADLHAAQGFALAESLGTNVEITAAAANKGSALRALCSRLRISPDEVLAIGDSGNDREMLALAGCSVAMGNAKPLIRRTAKYTTETNENNGVAKAVERFVLRP